jgi:hypothetical protein
LYYGLCDVVLIYDNSNNCPDLVYSYDDKVTTIYNSEKFEKVKFFFIMSNREITEWRNRIIEAIKISAQKMLEQKKKLGQKLVISENGVIKVVEAKDIK